MNGTMIPRLMGSWFIRQTAVAQAVMVIMEPAMWMFAQSGTTKLRILLAHAVFFCTFQIDRDGSCGRLGSQSSCVSRDLIFDQSERILFADSTCDHKLDRNADQVHDDNNKEYLPEDA